MAAMGHDGPLLPYSFKFPFLICLLKIINLIYEVESTPKIEFLLWQVECHIAESVFVSSNQISLNRIQNSCNRIKFIHFSCRFVESNFFRWIFICINQLSFQWIGIFLSSCLSCLSGLPFSIFPAFCQVLWPRFITLLKETSTAIVRFYFFNKVG